jgi:hypothetical protein
MIIVNFQQTITTSNQKYKSRERQTINEKQKLFKKSIYTITVFLLLYPCAIAAIIASQPNAEPTISSFKLL